MAYLTYEEFENCKTGVNISKDEFETLIVYAEDIINEMTGNNIEDLLKKIKKVTAMQITYMYMSGGIESILNNESVTSEKIGEYTYSAGHSKPINPLVKGILYSTGLLYRGGSYGC